MNFLRPAGGLVSFGRAAASMFSRHQQEDASSHEAGGILLGRLIYATDDVVIDEATAPTAEDERGRLFFNRSKVAAQRYINIAWSKSKGTRIYLGEWHTHPEDDPTPSRQDLRNWRRITRKAKYDQDSLIFVIVGRERIRTWACHKSSFMVTELGMV